MVDQNAIVSALAALAGSSVGALGPVFSNYLIQRISGEQDLLNRQMSQREALYAEFIKEAALLYAHSLTCTLETFDDLVGLYALVGRVRLVASREVLEEAEMLVNRIIVQYGERNLTVDEVRASALASKADPLAAFSTACRSELRQILQKRSVNCVMN